MVNLPNYNLTEKLHQSKKVLIYRGYRLSDNLPVVVKIPQAGYLSSVELTQLKLEYELGYQAQGVGVIQYYQLENHHQGWAIVTEDIGGIGLHQVIPENGFDIRLFLILATQLAAGLATIHQHNIIHKDIKPSNIIIKQISITEPPLVKIIDFGLAVPFNQSLNESNRQFSGTLAYVSPEQTGRINQTIDYRTDFYSLGITFYQLLTGKLPFDSNDSLELIHSHIAKTPVAPQLIKPTIPPVIGDIILKLLAKNVDTRYQSAYGLKLDLEQCLTQIQQGKSNEALLGYEFELGQHDYSTHFHIPKKLYGRYAEIAKLSSIFNRVIGTSHQGDTNNALEMALIVGDVGIGKTTLGQELYQPIIGRNGFFLTGKFDKNCTNIPYYALSQAFNDWCDQLLTMREADLTTWCNRITVNIANNGQALIDIIPKLQQVIGPQPELQSLKPAASRHRLTIIFEIFLQAICLSENPVVLFLDNLQWADRASLVLLNTLLNNNSIQNLLIIGAYNETEIDQYHTLHFALKRLQNHLSTTSIYLNNLPLDVVYKLVAETLHHPPEHTQTLAYEIYYKTYGNPLFVAEFLTALYQDGIVSFDQETQQWVWDIALVKQRSITDNVIELMTTKMIDLPVETLELLQLAACIGPKFNLQILAKLAKLSEIEALSQLQFLAQQGMIYPHNQRDLIVEDDRNTDFDFLHPQIQQMAYKTVAGWIRERTHVAIGHILYETYYNTSSFEEQLFNILHQFNQGIPYLKKPTEKLFVVRLNLQAVQMLDLTTAYQTAADYLAVGLKLITEDDWKHHYELTRDLYLAAIEVEYLSTNVEEADRLSQLVIQQAKTILEKITIYEWQLQFYMAQNQQQKAINLALEVLALLEIVWPTDPSALANYTEEIRHELPQTPSAVMALETLPVMTDPKQLATMRFLIVTTSVVFQHNPHLLNVVVITLIRLAIQHGNSALAVVGYSFYAALLCNRYLNLPLGYQYGQLAITLQQQYDLVEYQTRVLSLLNIGVHPWKERLQTVLKPLQQTIIEANLQRGDIDYAYYNAFHHTTYLLFSGNLVTTIYDQQITHLQMVEAKKLQHHALCYQIWMQITANLLGQSQASPERLQDKHFDETEMVPYLSETNNVFLLFSVYIGKVMLAYLFKQYDTAVEAGQIGEQYEYAGIGIYIVEHQFYYSLALLALYQLDSNKAHLEKVDQLQTRLRIWADHAPANYQHKYDLIEAERAKVLNNPWQATQHYEQAIKGANRYRFLHEEALAYERAGEFYLEHGMEQLAQIYLQNAYQRYYLWGASAKYNHLTQSYPDWLGDRYQREQGIVSASSFPSKQPTTTNDLDLESITKASQAIFGEIELAKLLEKIIRIMVENAGAERGLLILKAEGSWVIEAEILGDQVTILQSTPIIDAGGSSKTPKLSYAIINYVIRTGQELVLDDASKTAQFAETLYVQRKQPKSILCLPLLDQGQVIGILYLENNLTNNVFTTERLTVLRVLSAQMTISLANARLYDHLETMVAERTARLQTVAELSEQLTAILDMDTLLAELVNQIKESFGYYHAHIYLLNETKDDLIMVEGTGLAGATMKTRNHHILLGAERSLVARAAREQEVVVVDNVQEAPDWLPNDLLPDTYSEMAVPILYENEVVGVLDVQQNRIAGLDEGDRGLLRSLANQLGVALRNAQLYSLAQAEIAERKDAQIQLHRRNLSLAVRNTIAATISQSLELDQILTAVLNQMLALLEMDAGLIYLVDSTIDKLVAYTYKNVPATLLAVSRTLDFDAGVTGQAFTSGEPIVLEASYSTSEIAPLLKQEGFAILVSTPLISAGKSVGAITLGKRETIELRPNDLSLLAAIGQQIGVAVQNAQLYQMVQQTNAQLSKLNADKDKFFSIMAHDLKGPFMPVLGNAELLANSADTLSSEVIGKTSLSIYRAAKQTFTLLENLLQWARMQMGQMTYKPTSLQLQKIAQQTIDLLTETANIKEIQLINQIPADISVYADKHMVDTVIRNLANNALKFTSAGGQITITVELISSDKAQMMPIDRDTLPSQQQVTIAVADSGVGITQENIDKLFKIGTHHSTKGTDKEEGTGLGLIICQEMVAMNGGQIWMESVLGQGTTVKFTLPAHKGQIDYHDN